MESIKALSERLKAKLDSGNDKYSHIPAVMAVAFFVTPHGMRYHFIRSEDDPLASAAAAAIRDDMLKVLDCESRKVEGALRLLDSRSNEEYERDEQALMKEILGTKGEALKELRQILNDIRDEMKERKKEGA